MLYGRLLDKNGHRCEPLTDLSYPVVLLQRGESRGDRFIESLRSDLYGVLNVSDILYRNCAGSENHVSERSIFVFCSPTDVAIFLDPVCFTSPLYKRTTIENRSPKCHAFHRPISRLLM